MGEWIRLDSVLRTEVSWLWEKWIPRRGITLMEGRPGCGKSTILRHIAAGESRAGRAVVWLSSEEDLGSMVVPGMLAAGADLSRIYSADESMGPEDVRRLASKENLSLVVLDNVTLFIRPRENSYEGVQEACGPWGRMTQDTGVAVVGVRHHRKSGGDAMMSGIGSIGWASVARSVITVGRAKGRSVAAVSKHSLSAKPPALAFEINSTGGFRWLGETDAEADDITQQDPPQQQTKPPNRRDEIEEALSAGPLSHADLQGRLGIDRRTLAVYVKRLGLVEYEGLLYACNTHSATEPGG